MPKASITFRVPQDFEPLLPVITDFPGESAFIDYDDLDNLDGQLRKLIGDMIEIEFDEPHDPSEPVDRIVAILKDRCDDYLAVHQSYTEPSRGIRFRARIVVSTSDIDAEKRYPWEEGEPDVMDQATLRKAGFTDDEIRSIEATFFPASTPKPR